MPNVMGREFPYTPEGQAAALRYSRAIGMRGGGMMGFRPVGYQEGTGPAGAQLSGVEAQRSDVLAIVSGLMGAMEGSENDVLTYVSANRMDLENIATLPGKQFNVVRNVLAALPGPGSGPSTPTYIGPEEHRPPGLGIPAPLPPGLPENGFGSPGGWQRSLPPDYFSPPPLQEHREELPMLPEEIEVAHGGYVGRGRRGSGGGGILSLRR